MKNKKIALLIFSLIFIFALVEFSSSYEISSLFSSIIPPSSPTTQQFEKSMCESGSDFLVQISPLGCTPAVVRSDLLEENDVPVYCQLSATKINPLIQVGTIDSISFSGQYPKEISGIGFHPAKAALGVDTQLNSPLLNNIGYVVITLKKQENSSAMPDYISGNLTANIKYDVSNAFGTASLYLPLLTDNEWQSQKSQYGFWNGKGFLKAESISGDNADLSVYSGDIKVSTINLKTGQTSENIYFPGFECQATLKLKLEALVNPDTFAKIRIDSDVLNVAKGDKFMDNKCQIKGMTKNGIAQIVGIGCQEDSGTSNFDMIISPKLILNINGQEKTAGIGDYLYSEGNNRVYIGYIGTKNDATSSDQLYAYFLSSPGTADRLSDSDISFVSSVAQDWESGGKQESTNLINQAVLSAEQNLNIFGSSFNILAKWIGEGKTLATLHAGQNSNIFGQTISITGLEGVRDAELSGNIKEQYEKAKADYETIRAQLANEEYSTSSTYGEEALYNEIMLALDANQKATALELCKEFSQEYSNSGRQISQCNNLIKLSSQEASEYYITINGQIKRISFEGVYRPSFEDYGVHLVIGTVNGSQNLDLRKDEIVYIDKTGKNYVQLISLDDASATIKSNLIQANIAQSANVNILKLAKDNSTKMGDYIFTVTGINLKKLAKVSVGSNINNGGTKANFSFKIGIEQRAIILSPEKTRELIADLDEQIKTWKGFSDSLNGVVETLKTSCLVAGVALVAKNFLTNAGASGVARTDVMRGKGGWYEKCSDLVSKKTYSTQDECYSKNADQIDADVSKLSSIIDSQNSEIKKLQEGITTSNFLSENSVNTTAFMERYAPKATSYLGQNLPSTITDPQGAGDAVNTQEVLNYMSYDSWKTNKYSSDTLREMELYTRVLNDESSSESLKQIASQMLYSDFSSLDAEANNQAKISALASSLNVDSSKISALETQKNVKKMIYNGLTNGNLGSRKIAGFADNVPVAVVQTFPDGKQYIVVLDDSAGTSKLPIKNTGTGLAIYDSSGQIVSSVPSDLANVYFERFDSSSYTNPYKNAKLRYYETDPYKGMPAVVPFDTNNGWYAATKQTLATGSTTTTYDASGRVNNFYLCNVGPNGLEEFQTIGDDICQLINTGTGMSYNQFPGLSETEAKKEINCGVNAITQASKLYRSGLSGNVKISTQCGTANIQVGSPAVNVPEYSCQDFMSPKDCLLLFNLCDPVICPSSRCNLGGAYPVKDVVQSGIIGSLVLCLPNFKEGIIFPVCLTGVKAGIDSFLSIEQAYRDCLNESLTTGKVIGICDELHSIYICDFFWRQALPLTNIFIPKIVEFLTGQNTRGGGEYLSVASAWSGTEKAVDYFINYYGANAKTAFLARSTEGIGEEFCKVYTSAVVPTGADLLSSLTQADSPSQFTGRFEEIPMSTATVPPTSQYKVYYHIYAGQDIGAYYKVYLKGSSDSSYYQDTSQSVSIASGYVAVGGYADETKDIIATSGYKQLCINVNSQEECGFSAVSTSFAVNFIKDQYLASQVTEKITKEADCIGDSSNGIIRICGTDNPGKGTDAQIATNESRWQEVGYCDKEEIKCWIDTDSVKNAIKTTTVEGQALNEVSANYVNALINSSNYMTKEQYASAFNEIKNQNASAKITFVSNILDKIFYTDERAQLLLLRGNAYAELFKVFLSKQPKPQSTLKTSEGGTSSETETVSSGEETVTGMATGGEAIWQAAKNLVDGKWDEKRISSDCRNDYYCIYDNVCARFVVHAMINGGVKAFLNSQQSGCLREVCTIQDGKMVFNALSHSGWESIDTLISQMFTVNNNFVEIKDFSTMQKGDLIVLGYRGEKTQHIVIFDKYSVDKKTFDAFGDPGIGCTGTWVNYRCVGVTFAKPSMTEHYPIKTSSWYVYRVFRYVGEGGQQTTTAGTGGETSIPSETTEQTGTATETSQQSAETKKDTVGYKIFQEASNRAYKSKDDSFKFVMDSISAAGVTMPASSISILASNIVLNSDFAGINLRFGGKESTVSFSQKGINSEAEVLNRLETGDIIFIGKGCNTVFAVGIYHSKSNKVYFYSNMGNGAELVGIPITNSLSINNDAYIYKAYRYIADLDEKEKTGLRSDMPQKWTLESAVEEVKKYTGVYNENKAFFDQLIFDGVLSERECNEIGINNFLGLGQKDARWLLQLLSAKTANIS